jgi:hypothetical protein
MLELVCAVIYLLPCTCILGAILTTGYFGGAIATNMRLGESFLLPLMAGVMIWGGLYLRANECAPSFRCDGNPIIGRAITSFFATIPS